MTDQSNSFEKAFTTSVVADMVGIAESTLRKYALALEKEGYKIIRDDNSTRVFVENDVIVIRELKEVRERLKINVEDAARYVVTRVPTSPIQTMSPSDTVKIERYDKRYDEFEKKIDLQNELLHKLLKKIDEQDEKIGEMLFDMKEERNEKEQLLLDTEIQPPKSFFSRFFGNKKR